VDVGGVAGEEDVAGSVAGGLPQLRIHYRGSPAVEEGTPAPRRGPKAGDRLPDARIARGGHACWLHDALGAPTFQLLLCGPADEWDEHQVAALRNRYRGLVEIHRLSREASAGVLHDSDGQAFARLGVDRTAHYLVRPDGHIAYRNATTSLSGLERYLAHWLPNGSAGEQ
jgi:hypothetical protein